MPNYKGIDYLRNKLMSKRGRVIERYTYYEMKNIARDFKISTPPDLMWVQTVLGWCGKAVDSLADRLVFREFGNDLFDMNDIYKANNKDVIIDSAILGALIGSCDFIYISTAKDFPSLQVIDGRHATGIIDSTTNMLTEGYAVLEYDEADQPLVEAYFTAKKTEIFNARGEKIASHANVAPYPLLVPVIYRPDSVRQFGHSRISRACMAITESAMRTIKRSEIAAEFYSYPQKYILGMDESAEAMDKWKATMSSMLRIDKDEDGDHPVVGQFQQASMSPHVEQLRMFAGLFAGETGLTLDDLGFPTENPSSAEAIKASHETLRLTARKAQKTLGVGLLNAGYLAACIRDNYAYTRNQVAETTIKWEPIFEPDASGFGLIGDAVSKINAAMPGYIDEEKIRDLMGI